MARVELKNVVRNYRAQLEDIALEEDKGRPALDNINMTIGDGEIVSVVGPSGCGKSTLLKVIAGLETPDAGQVIYNEYDVTRIEPQQRGIGMVFQDYALYPAMKGKGNLHYYFEVHQKSEEEMQQRIRETAEMMGVGFEVLLGQKTDTLSGGEQQRVAIARCIVRDPLIFLMDEPISNLDAKLRERTRIEIKKLLRKFKVTTLYVTHDQQEAIFMGDRIVVMRKGRIEQIGTFDELYYTPANLFVATFIGTPPMALIPAEVERGGVFVKGGNTFIVDGVRKAVGDTRFNPPPQIMSELPVGKVRLGMRAEGWNVVPNEQAGAPVFVTRMERIPTEQATFAHGTLGDTSIVVVLPLDHPKTDVLFVAPDWEKAYFFSATDETVLHVPSIPELF